MQCATRSSVLLAVLWAHEAATATLAAPHELSALELVAPYEPYMAPWRSHGANRTCAYVCGMFSRALEHDIYHHMLV